MSESDAFVHIVDDDLGLRESLDSLFRSVGLQTRLYASAQEFLAATLPDAANCLVLDIRLPGISGLDFQQQLVAAGIDVPVVLMTGYGDIPMSVRGMKAGAIDFLTKPFRDQDMLDPLAAAHARDRENRANATSSADIQAHYATLTAREKEVMGHVVAGLMNKQIAYELGLSEITVKIHRGNAMRKMGARSLADLVRMGEVLHLPAPARR